jgi:hypothetical protein
MIMESALIVKSIGLGFNVIGAVLLAWRVYRILKALSTIAKVHEINIGLIAETLNTNSQIPIFDNSTEHLKRAKKFGNYLLVIGFASIALGGILQIIALWI